jgi:hypothetical protein
VTLTVRDEGETETEVREPGFYWVRLPLRGNVEVCRWMQTGGWLLAGWDGEYSDSEVTVLSERLVPPA